MYLYNRLPLWLSGREFACNAGTVVQSLRWEDPLKEETETPSSILAWRTPCTEKPHALYGVTESDMTEQLTLSCI